MAYFTVNKTTNKIEVTAGSGTIAQLCTDISDTGYMVETGSSSPYTYVIKNKRDLELFNGVTLIVDVSGIKLTFE